MIILFLKEQRSAKEEAFGGEMPSGTQFGTGKWNLQMLEVDI